MALTRAYLERVETFEAWARFVGLTVDMKVVDEKGVWYRNTMTEHAFNGFIHGLSVGQSNPIEFSEPPEFDYEAWYGDIDGMKRRSILYRVLGVAWYDAFHTAWGDLTPRIQEAIRELVRLEQNTTSNNAAQKNT